MTTVGFLHTSPVHVATFRALLSEHAPAARSGDAERLADRLSVPVLRIDRPLAQRAVAQGGRIAVVAAVESTLGPTRDLFEACAAASGTAAVIFEAPCLKTWSLFERGDLGSFHTAVARHVRSICRAGDVDVVVLAQASMAPAEALLEDLAVPVLSSPRLAVLRALEIAGATRATAPPPAGRAHPAQPPSAFLSAS